MELLIVVAIIGILIAVSSPSVSAGLDSLRLSSASDQLVAFLNGALNRAERLQQPVELVITPHRNKVQMFTNEKNFTREVELPEGVVIESVLPKDPDQPESEPVRILVLPGATVPGIGIQIANQRGSRRIVRVDPITGFPRVENVNPK